MQRIFINSINQYINIYIYIPSTSVILRNLQFFIKNSEIISSIFWDWNVYHYLSHNLTDCTALSIVYIYLRCTYDTYAVHESWADINRPIIEGYSTSFVDMASHIQGNWRQIYFWGTYVFRKNTSTRKHIKKEGKVGSK